MHQSGAPSCLLYLASSKPLSTSPISHVPPNSMNASSSSLPSPATTVSASTPSLPATSFSFFSAAPRNNHSLSPVVSFLLMAAPANYTSLFPSLQPVSPTGSHG